LQLHNLNLIPIFRGFFVNVAGALSFGIAAPMILCSTNQDTIESDELRQRLVEMETTPGAVVTKN
jgi:hypothetical protein